METRRFVLICLASTALGATVAGCTSSSDGAGTPPARATVTTTASATSAAPPTGSGVPASPTATSTGTGGAAGGGGSSSGPGLCTPTVMTFVVNPGNGAAGTDYFSVTATNASQQSCVTTGYPGVALLDASGRQVLQAARDTTSTPTTITLAPGEKATAVIGAESAAAGTSDCGTYPALLFTLPDNTDSTTLTHSTYACAVRVQAFVKGDGS